MENLYRVKVEPIYGTDAELDEEYLRGLDCDGFVIIAHQSDGNLVAIQHMNILGIAQGIADSSELRAGAALAEGIKKGQEIIAREKASNRLNDLADLFRKHEN